MVLILAVMLTVSCTHAQETGSIELEVQPALSLAATPVDLDDEKHRDAVGVILKTVGLSSTGRIYCAGEIRPASGIEGFCQEGETVIEYRTSHLFDRTLAVVWYNPSSRGLYLLYSQAPGTPDKPDAGDGK